MKYLGNYRGVVLSHEPGGKCKIYVVGVYPRMIGECVYNSISYIDKIPIAEPAMSIFGGTTDAKGISCYPNIGSNVWVFFEGGDIRYPVYFATIPGGDTWVSKNEDEYVINTKHSTIVINDADDSQSITIKTGKSVNIIAPVSNITGDVKVDGKLDVSGNIKGQGEVADKKASMSVDRTIYNGHKHSNSAGSTTPPDSPQ